MHIMIELSTIVRFNLESTSFGFTRVRRHRSEKPTAKACLTELSFASVPSSLKKCSSLSMSSIWFNDNVRVGGLAGKLDKRGSKPTARNRKGQSGSYKGQSEQTAGPALHVSSCTDSLKVAKTEQQ
jgi:hypothetical protein